MTLQTVKTYVVDISQRPWARLAGQSVRWALTLGVFALLVWRVRDIGWSDITDHLPSSIWFYALIVLLYFVQPVSELLIYQGLWRREGPISFGVFLRKRVYNFAVMSYSGEAYLYMWARKALSLGDRTILAAIKDNVVLSALVSNTATVIMVLFFMATGQMQRFFQVSPDIQLYVAIAAGLALVLAVAVLRFRHSVLSMAGKALRTVIQIHGLRLIVSLVLQALIWAIALPSVPLQTWLVLVTLQLVLTRIPFLPNQDLIFLTLVVSVAGHVEARDSAVAGTFLMITALTQVLHLVSFIGAGFSKQTRIATA
ncbi:MAG: hypothetical protein AAF337_00205 [Pseudomonadota bacterium]